MKGTSTRPWKKGFKLKMDKKIMEINKLTFYNIRYNIKIEGVYNRGRKVYEISNGSRSFFKNTIVGCSNSLLKNICNLLEEQKRITFEQQRSFDDNEDMLYFESKADLKRIIIETTMNIKFTDFYEYWEFIKLYKYSVPLFFECADSKEIIKNLLNIGATQFNPNNYMPEFVIDTTLKESLPLYWVNEEGNILIKFVLQKSYYRPETFEQIDYRYPIVIYINQDENILEIRYDAEKYAVNNMAVFDYQNLVMDCIEWLTKNLRLELNICNHANTIQIINDKQGEKVRIFRQLMQLSTGASADLTASEDTDYVLPFIGELKELINENAEAFEKADEVKQILLQYLADKEATASYPYIYIKWVKPVESQSYIVKVTFDYFNQKYTLLQHITGDCKDLGMERMNNAIKYLCQSGAFIKGEKT